MNLRVFNQRLLEPGAQLFMIAGIIFLCQPWVPVLHEWSVLIMLIGLISFNFAVHIPAPEPTNDDTAPVTGAAREDSHG